jgi:hypothetical protein
MLQSIHAVVEKMLQWGLAAAKQTRAGTTLNLGRIPVFSLSFV